jgi:hypothetical protein
MSNRGRGRGRKSNNQAVQPMYAPNVHGNVDINNLDDNDFSPPNQANEKQPRTKKQVAKSNDELRRVMDIIQSRISVIIDSLEGDDNDISLRRNVVTAVKHLKQINSLLE